MIRLLAIGVFRTDEHILVAEGMDPTSGLRFYRPLGGGIEFGEHAEVALKREIREELGADIINVQLLGVLENLFEYAGKSRHEVIFVFDATFVDRTLYSRPELPVMEAGTGWSAARWMSLADFSCGTIPLVPDGLLALLLGQTEK